jgi:hypothetical protein
MKTNVLTFIFKTLPHGEHEVCYEEAPPTFERYDTGNTDYTIYNSEGNEMTFTGEELTSLTEQWQSHVAKHQKVER